MARKVYSVAFKLSVAQLHDSIPDGAGDKLQMTAEKFGIGRSTVALWVKLHRDGCLSLDNAVAVSRKPRAVITGDVYHLGGLDFKTQEDAIRHAVALAGGLTVSKMTTVEVCL